MNRVKTMLVVALGLATLGVVPSRVEARGIYGLGNVQTVVLNNFATRDAQLRSEIGNDVSTGLLSPAVANNLTSELNSISAQEQSAMSFGGLNDIQIAQMNNMFTDVTNQLSAAEGAAPYGAPLAYYGAPVAAPIYTAAPVYASAPVWGGGGREGRNFMERSAPRDFSHNWQANRPEARNFTNNWQANRPEARNFTNNWQANRPMERNFTNNWQANRPMERQLPASAPRVQVSQNVRFDAHRR